MDILYHPEAEEDLTSMDRVIRGFFLKHIEKVGQMPLRRHLKFGLPFNVENVTRQARLVYSIENNKLYVIRCFSLHKDYERWYKSFK